MKKIFSVSWNSVAMIKKISTVLSVCITLATTCFGQQNNIAYFDTKTKKVKTVLEREERASVNVGLLMGGGSLIGADLEFLPGKRVGFQFGAGISSLGFGITYHFKPYINSQFVSVQYWHQGFDNNHYASYLGPMYVFRAKKIFQFGIGLGSILSKGPRWETHYAGKEEPPMILLYNIGLYFPF